MDHIASSGQVESSESIETDPSSEVDTIPYTALVLGVAMGAFIVTLMAYVITKIHWSRRNRHQDLQEASSVAEQGTVEREQPSNWWSHASQDGIFSIFPFHHTRRLEVPEATTPTATATACKFATEP